MIGRNGTRRNDRRRTSGQHLALALTSALLLAGATSASGRGALGATTAPPAELASLDLVVTGVRGTDGTVYLAIYDCPEAFPKTDGMRTRLSAEVTGTPITVTVPDLPPGRYAVAAFHDQNGNGTFDQGLFGIPLEGYGFSGNPSVFPAGPTFDDAAVTVAPPRTRTKVRMRYGL